MTGAPRTIASAELLAVGSELLYGETRDTNSGDLAAELTALGVEVVRLTQLPDDQPSVVGALRDALARADLVMTTGGLGPTPDDLTREAIAEVMGEEPVVDPAIEAWLAELFERRRVRYAPTNRKQAWLIPSASSLPNPHGTAPGWWVEAPGGRVVVALPGPPREMRPMWREHVLPRLRERGLGLDRAAETLRLTGIGESLLVDVIGEELLRGTQPQVATYARVDAVDLRVSATGEPARSARSIVDETIDALMPRIGAWVFAHGDEGWPEALGRRLAGRTLTLHEEGLGGHLLALLGAEPWVLEGDMLPWPRRRRASRSDAGGTDGPAVHDPDLRAAALAARAASGADVALAVRARERRGDMAVTIAVASDRARSLVRRRAFLAGDLGRRRAANVACAELWARLAARGTRGRRPDPLPAR